ncbi:unnamed protein product, partial [Closterium sp. NIES-54]
DRGITVTFPVHGRTAICTDASTGALLATFTREPDSCLFILHTVSHQVAESSQVNASLHVAESGQVPASPPVAVSGLVAVSCCYRSLSHLTVLWHHRLGHPSIPCLRSMTSQHLVSGLPSVFASLPRSSAPPCTPFVKGRLRATPHSSLRTATAPFQTLHLDVRGPAACAGSEQERFFLVVVDDYSSLMFHDQGLHRPFFGPVPGVASEFHVWGCLALVRDTSADKLLTRAIPCVFLGFPVDSSDFEFYHPPLHRFLDSRDIRFDEFVSYYTRYPCRGLPVPPPPLFLAPSPPPALAPSVPPPPPGPALSGVSHSTPLPLVARACSGGTGVGVAGTGGASSGVVGARGASARGASSRGTGAGGAGAGGAISESTDVGGTTTAPPHRHDTHLQAAR